MRRSRGALACAACARVASRRRVPTSPPAGRFLGLLVARPVQRRSGREARAHRCACRPVYHQSRIVFCFARVCSESGVFFARACCMCQAFLLLSFECLLRCELQLTSRALLHHSFYLFLPSNPSSHLRLVYSLTSHLGFILWPTHDGAGGGGRLGGEL